MGGFGVLGVGSVGTGLERKGADGAEVSRTRRRSNRGGEAVSAARRDTAR
jgi:hypothetical protein